MKSKRSDFLLKIVLLVGDAVLVFLSFIFVYYFRFHTFISAPKGVPELSAYIQAVPVAVFIWILIFAHFGLYNISSIESRWNQAGNITKAVFWGTVALLAASTLYRAFSYSRLVIGLSFLSSIILLNVFRFAISALRIRMLENISNKKRVLIIGTDDTAIRIALTLKDNAQYVSKVIGFISPRPEMLGREIAGVRVVDTLDNVEKHFSKDEADEVILTLSTLPHEKIVNFIIKCSKELITWKMIPDVMQMTVARLGLEEINGIPIMRQKDLPLDHVGNRILKRVFDVFGSLAGLIVFSPVLLVFSLLIKAASGGGIFYRQKRVGEDGREFNLYKLRSMKPDAEDSTGPVWARKDDERTTKVGKIMRKYNIDEIPQFWNVLKGDMSIVGPRPERPHFVCQFKEQIPYYMARHRVKSGLTGWAQVNGYRGDTSLGERIKHDLYYMENWSIMFDLRIILMTLKAFKNAY
ncbi:MAG: undecaprenyl-phosphate glucose phosphotransferase [Candidatus Aureabacteria bacterium]|nr:undecaprenyl-phosphate glucose phosphotransferase [Candidatus Auribacterota bacterium]